MSDESRYTKEQPKISESLNDVINVLDEQTKVIMRACAPDTGLENRLEICSLEIKKVICELADLAMALNNWEYEITRDVDTPPTP